MIGPGLDRGDLESYNPQNFTESFDPNELMGCHKGRYAGLNISNPEPGENYAWADSSPKGLMQAQLKGYRVVPPESSAQPGYATMDAFNHMDIDSASSGYPGLILVSRSAENERVIQAEEDEKREDLLRSGAAEAAFLEGGTAAEAQTGSERFKGKDHRTFRTEGESESSKVVDSWTVADGISR